MSSLSEVYPDPSSSTPTMSSPTKVVAPAFPSRSSTAGATTAASDDVAPPSASSSPATPTGPPTMLEVVAGVQGSRRRFMAWYFAAFTLATAVRMASFHPVILGEYLAKNLAPVERDDVRWGYILLVRAYDLALGGYLWPRVDGLAKRDGALFGAIVASVSRIGLLVFERAYFLLSTETVSALFLIDLVSLIAAFSLLPILLPHSVESRATSSALMRLERHPELIINIALSIGISTFVCAFLGYAVERLGAQHFIKVRTFERSVPSALLADTLTPLQMLETPTVPIHSLRQFLEPLSMPRHIIHSLFLSVLTIPFVSIFPTTGSVRLALIAFLLVAPQTATWLWDVFPLHGEAAFYVGAFEGIKAAISSAVSAWTIEELRARRERIETMYAVALIEDEDEKSSLLVVAEETVQEEPATSA